MYCSHKGNDYVHSPVSRGSFLFFGFLDYFIGIRRFQFQAVIEIFLDVEHIFLVVVPCQLVVGVLGQIVLVGEERPDTAQLEDALAAVHDGQFETRCHNWGCCRGCLMC